jgi:hypothetical protein
MTISVNQQVDYLWKKIGYNVAKTDVTSIKDATNERIPSAPYIPGDKIWAETDQIPGIIPSTHSNIVHIHSDNHSNTVACTMDITASIHRTWLTGLLDWIPVDFGSTYQIKVYLDVVGAPNPQATGFRLYAAGGTVPDVGVGLYKDEWFFDYESGVLNFIGESLPDVDFTNKTIYICGARYVGFKGLTQFPTATFGNITITGNTVSSTGNIVLDPAGANTINVSGATLTNLGAPVNLSDAVSLQYLNSSLAPIHTNQIYQLTSSASIIDTGLNGQFVVNLDGTTVASITQSGATFAALTLSGNSIASTGNIILTPASGDAVVFNTTGAVQIPAGTTQTRPAVGQPGYIRFNTTSGILEVHDGTSWISTQAQIGSQVILGDDTTTSWQLNKSSYAGDMLVMINGVVQLPFVAYNVTGNQITFPEPPKSSDTIEVRYISQSISEVATAPTATVVDPMTIIVGTSSYALDSFSAVGFRSVKYILSITSSTNDARFEEWVVVHNGVAAVCSQLSSTTVGIAPPNLGSYYATIQAGLCTFYTPGANAPGTKVKMYKMYFTV